MDKILKKKSVCQPDEENKMLGRGRACAKE